MLAVVTVLAGADYVYQRFAFMRSLRMSKREVKDEHEAVGRRSRDPGAPAADPHGPRAPAHDGGGAERLGRDHQPDPLCGGAANTRWALPARRRSSPRAPISIALQIREIAEENDVPIVENPPLARALYAGVEIDREIPPEHYKAVAEIIGYVFRLKGKIRPRAAGAVIELTAMDMPYDSAPRSVDRHPRARCGAAIPTPRARRRRCRAGCMG